MVDLHWSSRLASPPRRWNVLAVIDIHGNVMIRVDAAQQFVQFRIVMLQVFGRLDASLAVHVFISDEFIRHGAVTTKVVTT